MIGISTSIHSQGITGGDGGSSIVPEGMIGAVVIYGQSESLGSHSKPAINTVNNLSNCVMLTGGVRPHYDTETVNYEFLMDVTENQTNVPLEEVDAAMYGETMASGIASVLHNDTNEDIGFVCTGKEASDYNTIKLNSTHLSNTIQSLSLLGKNAGKQVYVLGVIFAWGAAESLNNISVSSYKQYLRELRKDFQRYISKAMGTTHGIKFIIPQFSVLSYNGTPQNIAQAQIEESFENPNVHLLPTHGIQAKNGYADVVHWSAKTSESNGSAAGELLKADMSGIRPLSITDSGTQIIITVDGNNAPLKTDSAISDLYLLTGSALLNNGIRIDSGTITGVVLSGETITIDYIAGSPSTVSVAYNELADQPQTSVTDIWDGVNHCAIFKLPTNWTRPAEIIDDVGDVSSHIIDSAFNSIINHPHYMSLITADSSTHTATKIMDYGKNGINYIISGGSFPSIETVNSRPSLLWDGASNFISENGVMPIGDYSIIYVGKSNAQGIARTILNAYPSHLPFWKMGLWVSEVRWGNNIDAVIVPVNHDLSIVVISFDCKTQKYKYSVNGGSVIEVDSTLGQRFTANKLSKLSVGGREQENGTRDDFLSESNAIDYTSMLGVLASDIHGDGTDADIITDLKTYYSIT